MKVVKRQHPSGHRKMLKGMSWIRVFSACQALMMPSRCYGVTHKQCREVLHAELGFCPAGRPGTRTAADPKGFRKGGEKAIHKWLYIVSIVRQKEAGIVQASDITLVEFDPKQVKRGASFNGFVHGEGDRA